MIYPDPIRLPREQDDVCLLALTVLGEAEGEPDLGKYAVAWVIKNRMLRKKCGVAEVALAPWQFSCWNRLNNPRRSFLEDTIMKSAKNLPLAVWTACVRAAHETLDGLAEDPTEGATHYCVSSLWGNDDSDRAKPRWFSRQAIASGVTQETARIGKHTFGVSA